MFHSSCERGASAPAKTLLPSHDPLGTPASRCVEVGGGSGYVICSLALMLAEAGHTPHCLVTDLSSNATAASQQTLLSHAVSSYRMSISGTRTHTHTHTHTQFQEQGSSAGQNDISIQAAPERFQGGGGGGGVS